METNIKYKKYTEGGRNINKQTNKKKEKHREGEREKEKNPKKIFVEVSFSFFVVLVVYKSEHKSVQTTTRRSKFKH